MRTLIDFDRAAVFSIPTVGGAGRREGMLIEGPQGWGEFSPGSGADDGELGRWLTAAIEAGTVGWPDPRRGRVPVAVTVPAVDPAAAYDIAADSGCTSAAVVVAEQPDSLGRDAARLEAVRDALGPGGAIRCDAKGRWDVHAAPAAISSLNKAAGGLEFVEQPCPTLTEIAAVRRRVDVPIAVDETVRGGGEALARPLTDTADVAVLACGPLGGVRRTLRIAEDCGLPCVVSSAGETSIGLAAGLALAGALPELRFACELGTRTLLAGDLVAAARSLVPADGHLPVAPMPAAPDRDLMRRFALTEPDAVAVWRDRLRRAQSAL